jgi:hypothetical protein
MNRDIIVFDFETGGRNPHRCQPTQIAAIALDGRNFKLKGEFNSLMRPIIDDDKALAAGVDPLEEGALKVTGQTREKLAKAPLPKGVWKKFCNFVNKYNWKGTSFFAPIPCGFNILGYDMHIVNRLCKEYGPWDESYFTKSIILMLWTMYGSGPKVIQMLSQLAWIACESVWGYLVKTLMTRYKMLKIPLIYLSSYKSHDEQFIVI